MPRKPSAKKNNNSENNSFDWTSFVSGIASTFVRTVTDPLFEKINEVAKKIVESLQKGLAGMFLMLLGLAFVMVGLAMFINDVVAISDGVGYSIVGMAAFLIGLIIIKK